MLRVVPLLRLYAGRCALDSHGIPEPGGNQRLVPALEQLIVVLPHPMVLVVPARDFLTPDATIGDLPDIDRVVQYGLDEVGRDAAGLVVPADALPIAVGVQPAGDAGIDHVRVGELVKDQANQPGLRLLDHELALLDPVAIGGLVAVLLALANLLPTPRHGLRPDVLALDLRNGGQYRDHQLLGVLGEIYAVPGAY